MGLFDAIIAPSLKAATDLIGQFHESPTEKAAALQAIQDASVKMMKDSQDYDARMNEIASANITAEAKSGDKFTERARPSFMYVVISILAFNYMGIPLFQVFGSKVAPIQLPGDLLTLFGVCITGYVVSRGVEKIAAMPGDSQANIAGIVKVSQKN